MMDVPTSADRRPLYSHHPFLDTKEPDRQIQRTDPQVVCLAGIRPWTGEKRQRALSCDTTTAGGIHITYKYPRRYLCHWATGCPSGRGCSVRSDGDRSGTPPNSLPFITSARLSGLGSEALLRSANKFEKLPCQGWVACRAAAPHAGRNLPGECDGW
ncbi:hypothetical protein DPEC_G00361950 [Dallia pectoralis]|nr:hypothetical protein DPEC_G00361950 [Dallia pectoralis]